MTTPAEPLSVRVVGMVGDGTIRLLARVRSGRGSREVAIDLKPDFILQLADALRATRSNACGYGSDPRDGNGYHVGHAVWHLENPTQPMPCIDHNKLIDVPEDSGPLTCNGYHYDPSGLSREPCSAIEGCGHPGCPHGNKRKWLELESVFDVLPINDEAQEVVDKIVQANLPKSTTKRILATRSTVCEHLHTFPGKDIPLRYGSYRSEVCGNCGDYRWMSHSDDSTIGTWRPASGYEADTEDLGEDG